VLDCVDDAGNAAEASRLLHSVVDPTSSYESILLAITYALLSQQSNMVSCTSKPTDAWFPALRFRSSVSVSVIIRVRTVVL